MLIFPALHFPFLWLLPLPPAFSCCRAVFICRRRKHRGKVTKMQRSAITAASNSPCLCGDIIAGNAETFFAAHVARKRFAGLLGTATSHKESAFGAKRPLTSRRPCHGMFGLENAKFVFSELLPSENQQLCTNSSTTNFPSRTPQRFLTVSRSKLQ